MSHRGALIGTTEIVPSPEMSEGEIRDRVAHRRAEIVADGGIVLRERRVRNTAFDRRGQRTSTELVVDWSQATREPHYGEAAITEIRLVVPIPPEPIRGSAPVFGQPETGR